MPVPNVSVFLCVSQSDEQWLETKEVLENPEEFPVLLCIFHRVVIFTGREQVIIFSPVYLRTEVEVFDVSNDFSLP